jgi:predicted Zn-dependent protease
VERDERPVNRTIAVAGILATALGACSNPVVPTRGGVYAFADTVIIGVDTTVYLFRWPANRLPVRFWADRRGNMAFLIARAVSAWEDQFLYGEFRGVLVSDSTDADVIARWADSVPPDAPPDMGSPVFACSGVTTFDYDSALVGPVHVFLSVFNTGAPATAGQVQACMRRVSTHEIGHALGIGFPSGRHSPFAEDVMYGAPIVDYPSRFDRRTVETLYHSQPTVGPPPR